MNYMGVRTFQNITTIKMNSPEVDLKYVMMEGLGQCVMRVGISKMPLWCVGHLDSLHMVNMACIEMCSRVDVIFLYCFKGAIADRSGLYSTEQGVTEWNMLHCNGTEATTAECLVISTGHCLSNEVAGVICQGK